MTRLALSLSLLVFCACPRVQADSTLVFNEIMYHPSGDETLLEWIELHNQMAVDLDVTGWSLAAGVSYTFPAGTVVPGRGYLVISISPETLVAATGLTNVSGPFQGRLSNSGERLELRNNNQRVMDSIRYGTEGKWPVGADGAGVSLAKIHPDLGSRSPENWTASAEIGGTPGIRNFPEKPDAPRQTSLFNMTGQWRFSSQPQSGAAWRQGDFDDNTWPAGAALFYSGQTPVVVGSDEAIPTLFSSGINSDGLPVTPGNPDPHYHLTQSAYSTPPPPAIPATVISHHPAWLPNDGASQWISVLNPGTANVPPGDYHYRTQFDLTGFDAATARIQFRLAADNNLNNVRLNGTLLGLQFAAFNTFSPEFVRTNGFVAGTNTLEFLTSNGGTSPNPAGFRVRISGTAFKPIPQNTPVPPDAVTHYFRKQFVFDGAGFHTLELRTVVADGAVFYLNGVELHRFNMPAGEIASETFALTGVASGEILGPVMLPGDALLRGTNVFAVEVHRAEQGHSGMLFGAELAAIEQPDLRPQLVFNEIGAATDWPFQIEIANAGTNTVSLNGFAIGGSGAAGSGHTFPNGNSIAPGEFLVLSQFQLGFRPNAGNKLYLYTPNAGSLLDAVVVQNRPIGRHPDATGRWLHPSDPTFGASNVFNLRGEIVINEIMYHPQPRYEQPAGPAENLQVIPIDAVWKYHQGGIDLGTAWREFDYDDSAWPDGAALLYVENDPLPAPKNTPLTLGRITYYFRKQFVFDGSTDGVLLSLRPVIDDGAVFYLNGVEVFRFNMPQGPVTYSTLSATAIGNATFTGPHSIPADALRPGVNVLAVEVHQQASNSSDIVFGTELWAAVSSEPAVPYQESTLAWIELYNRGPTAMDLTGWRIEDAVDFVFPPGTVMAPDSHLVVANDRDAMQELHPGITVLGNFSRRLSRRSDSIVLIDAFGNPANEVRYYDGGRWPASADGGGSSLELRNPHADNSSPEAWAASNESENSQWRNYSYRMAAVQAVGPANWNEFVVGLLDAGEVLLDDLRVIESPGGSAQERLQNGSFENGAAAWRFLGNHRHSSVIVDPDDPSNRVLHLVATGATEHMHNHLETTLADGAGIVDGREYEISFRAKWLAGSPRLNTRLYFNRAARTTILDTPELDGTPGRRNSRYEPNIGPTFIDFAHAPPIPQPGEPVTVSVKAQDPDGVASCTLWWAADGGSWNSLAMNSDGTSRYSASVPGRAAGSLVQFYVEAEDQPGVRSTFPAKGPNSRALYRVSSGDIAPPQLHHVRILMTAADANWMHSLTNVMSEERLGATVVYNESRVFYDAGVKLQASQRGRANDARVGFSIRFPPHDLFRGVHQTITLDRSGGHSGRGGPQDEIILKHIINHAGGMAGMYDDLVHVTAPLSQHTGTALLIMAKYGDEFLDTQFADGSDGGLFKLELIYHPTTTTDGNPQSPKLPQPDLVVGTDFRNLGEDKENYRWNFLIENKRRPDDYTSMIRLAQAFDLNGAALDQASRELMDVDQWMRTFAMKSLTGDPDTYGYGLPHNFMIYFRPGDGRALGFLWDMDLAWQRPIGASLVPGSNIGKIVSLPHNLRLFHGHLLDIITTTYNADYIARWTTHYGNVAGQNYSGILDYIQQRRSHVLSQLPAPVPFAITSNGGADFITDQASVVIGGTAWIDLRNIVVEGRDGLAWTWPAATSWQVSVPLILGANRLRFVGHDFQGQPVATREITVTSTALSGAQDSDGDGMPDLWEVAHGFDPFSPHDAALDSDGDGMTNLEEYLAGTDPRDAGSSLRLGAELRDGDTIRLSFVAVAGRSYTVEYQSALGAPWETWSTLSPQLQDVLVQITDLPSGQRRFYRLITPARN